MGVCVCVRAWVCARVCGWQCPPRPLTAVYPAPVYGQYAQAPSPQLAPIPHNKVEGKLSTCPATQVHTLISFLTYKIHYHEDKAHAASKSLLSVTFLCVLVLEGIGWRLWIGENGAVDFCTVWLAPLPGHRMSWCMPPLPMCLPLHDPCMLSVLCPSLMVWANWLFCVPVIFLCWWGGWHTSQGNLTVISKVAQHSLQLLTIKKAK